MQDMDWSQEPFLWQLAHSQDDYITSSLLFYCDTGQFFPLFQVIAFLEWEDRRDNLNFVHNK